MNATTSRARPFRASVPSLGDTGTSAVGEVGTSLTGRLLVPASPARTPHWMPGMTRHTHQTRDERLACEAEHATIRARWDALNRPQE